MRPCGSWTASQDGNARAGESVAAALAGVRQTTRFTDPDSLDAYYAVEAALAAGDTWPPDVREGLRRAADRLAERDSEDKLAGQLRTVANALTPETGPLLDAARALRTRIEASADPSTGQGRAPVAPGADSDDTLRRWCDTDARRQPVSSVALREKPPLRTSYQLPMRRLFWLPIGISGTLVVAVLVALVVVAWLGLMRVEPVQAHLGDIGRLRDLGMAMEQVLFRGRRGTGPDCRHRARGSARLPWSGSSRSGAT